jgi:MoaA/NifB/PqqE/SkfB family radical SAM enzyme
MKGKEIPKYPLDIFLEVSNVCDLKCIMCATFSAINPNRHNNIAGTTRGFLDYAALQPMEENLKHALKVHCFGYGEPTINPNFKKFIKHIGQYEVLVDFFTNGMHLTEDLVQFIVEHSVGDITVSFSGATKIEYESAYQGGIFEQVLGGLARLRDRKKETGRKYPRVSINSLAYKHHLEKFDQFVPMMADHGVNVIYLKPLLECGNRLPDLVGQSALITPHIAETVIARARKIAAERDIELSIAPELYVNTIQEEYERHVDFSGLSKEEYDERKDPIPIEQFKEVARNTKQIPVQVRGSWDVPPLDIEHGTEEQYKEILNVGKTAYAHGAEYHFYCMEPFKTMYVLENGQTKPCCNVPGDIPAIGNVIDYGGEKVWNGKGFATYRNAILNNEYPLKGCQNCLRFKTGPKTHFVDQMVDEFFHWYSSIYQYDLKRGDFCELISLGDGAAIIARHNTSRQI